MGAFLRNSILSLCLLGNLQAAYCQRNYFARYTSVGVGIGSSVYYGDLALPKYLPTSTTNSLRWHAKAEIIRHFNSRVSGSLSFSWIRLGADDFEAKDIASFARNLHFRNDVKELSLKGLYNLLKDGSTYKKRLKVVPYLSGGISYFFHNPKAKTPQSLGSQWIELAPLHTEGQGLLNYHKPYKLTGINIPLGLGINYKIREAYDISIEASYRVSFTDYLDDVSGVFINPQLLTDNLAKVLSNRAFEEIAARTGMNRKVKLDAMLSKEPDPFSAISNITGTGVIRGTDKGNDNFWTFSVKIQYHIPDKIRCP